MGKDTVELHQELRNLVGYDQVGNFKISIVVQDIENLGDRLSGDILSTETHHSVEDRERITHGAIGLLSNDLKGFVFGLKALLACDILEILSGITDGNTLEVKDLATRENGRYHLVLLGGSQDKDGMSGGFLQGLKEGVEGCIREHMHLIDDIDLILAYLGGDTYLLDERTDSLHTVVGGRIQLKNIESKVIVLFGRGVLLIDFFG